MSELLKPGTFSAAEKSIETTRACGYGERTARAYSILGRDTSNVYFARPLTLSGPSRRLTRVPTTVRGVAGQLYFGSTGGCGGAPPRPPPPCGGCPCGGCARSLRLATRHPLGAVRRHTRHRFVDARERPAAADVAVESLLDLLGRRVGVFLEQADARHDEARRAEAAHQRVLVAERLLHGMQLAAGGREPVHGADLLALDLDRQRRARVDRPAVDDHRAGAAGAAIAAALVAREIGAHAQRVEQRDARLDLEAQRLA